MHRFCGTHILGEFYGVSSALLCDSKFLSKHLRKGIKASGATLCSMQVKEFETGGLTILALLSESHASIHTYPEFSSLFFDAFTCGETCNPHRIVENLIEALQPKNYVFKELKRGVECK